MRRFFLTLILTTLSISLSAQPRQVRGVVTSAEDGLGLPGVSVLIKGTDIGTSTDLDGNFTIKADRTAILLFTCLGYKDVESAASSETIKVVMNPDATMLDEVVAIGYGVMKKSDLTGSVASVKGEQLQKTPASGLDQALQGLAAGVTVNAVSGQPGAAAEVRIRGIGTVNNSAPIFVVDGVIVDNINYLSPNDIAATEILKDASATAIYGSRGANGVILVTTRKGSTDGKVRISFDAYAGVQNAHRKLSLMGAGEFARTLSALNGNKNMDILKERGLDAWVRASLIGTRSKYHPSNMNYSKIDTDWQDEVFNSNAPIQNYHVSANGGNDKSQWALSASWFTQDGTIIGSDYRRLSLRSNASHKLTGWLKVGENISFMTSQGRNAMNNNSSPAASVLSAALAMAPWDPVRYPSGAKNFLGEDLGGRISAASNFKNVVNPYSMVEYSHPEDITERWVGDVYLELNPLRELTFRSDVSLDLTNTRSMLFKDKYALSDYDKADKNFLTRSMARYSTVIVENTLTWMRDFGKHSVNLMGGQTMEEYNMYSIGGSGASILNPESTNWYLSQTTEDNTKAGDGAARSRRFALLGRAHYSYDSRYMLTVNFRADGSSKFQENTWGYFPSVAAAWRIDKEPWFGNKSWLELLKLRIGWGRIGNDKIGDNAFILTMFNSGPTFVDYVLGSEQALANGATILTYVNKGGKWETTEQVNLGLDFGLWGNKLTGTVELFSRDTKEMLLNVKAPAHVGNRYDAVANVGTVNNKGFELTLDHRSNFGPVNYSIGGNLSLIKNMLTALNGGAVVYGDRTKSDKGYPLYTFWGYEYEGIYRTDEEVSQHLWAEGAAAGYSAGDARYRDIDGNGMIDDNDKTDIGNPFPWLTYGINASAEWRNFDFQIFLQGVYGNEIYNAMKLRTEGSGNEATLSTTMRNVWTETNPDGDIPNPMGSPNNKLNSSRFVESGAYLRLKNLQIGYSLPSKVTEKLKLSRLRFYLAGSNIFTLTGYSGYDPEVGGGVDYGNYPQSRTFMLGLNLDF